jgi:putative transcriptional regulator
LIANPLMFTTSQTYFNKAVILILNHGADGSAGVVLNKPTQHVMGEFKDATTLPDVYDPCTLYLGGDVGPEVLNLLHMVEGVEDATAVVSGVYVGGIKGVGKALEDGDATALDVKLLTRYAGWGPGQLEEEVRRGVWIVAAASRDVIMGRYEPGSSGSELLAHGDDGWHRVLQLMGGEYAGLSDAVREEYRADIMEFSTTSNDDDEPDLDDEEQHDASVMDSDDDEGHMYGHGI